MSPNETSFKLWIFSTRTWTPLRIIRIILATPKRLKLTQRGYDPSLVKKERYESQESLCTYSEFASIRSRGGCKSVSTLVSGPSRCAFFRNWVKTRIKFSLTVGFEILFVCIEGETKFPNRWRWNAPRWNTTLSPW